MALRINWPVLICLFLAFLFFDFTTFLFSRFSAVAVSFPRYFICLLCINLIILLPTLHLYMAYNYNYSMFLIDDGFFLILLYVIEFRI